MVQEDLHMCEWMHDIPNLCWFSLVYLCLLDYENFEIRDSILFMLFIFVFLESSQKPEWSMEGAQ